MTQRVLILASANNGLTQRATLAVRRSGRTASRDAPAGGACSAQTRHAPRRPADSLE
ncbi:hypothetical protein [Nocardia gipuzkoensis]|uniref:hypothetical protein n=1 Tax=Nocardia gipuzkoensis TaxID=2749991 RepID=UPI003EDF3174